MNTGHIAIVTGAARGIGFAAAARLHAQGIKVALWDLDAASAQAAAARLDPANDDAIAMGVDVASPNSVAAALDAVIARFGKVDILVHAAGIYPTKAFADLPFDEWRKVLAVNLDGAFLCCQAVFPHMRAKGYGRIVTIASATVQKGNANFAAYAASKAGVIGLTRVIASEGGPHGITANVIAPGVIASEGVKSLPESQAILDAIITSQPVKRNGEPSDIAAAVAYLTSPEAEFITGQTVGVNGGSVYN